MIRAIGFAVASMVAGFLSGILAPYTCGVHGAILGGMLAGGVLAGERYNKEKGAFPVKLTLAIAVLVSLSAFLMMYGWDAVPLCFPDMISMFILTSGGLLQTTWHSALTCFFISLGVLLCCRNCSLRQCWCLRLLYFFGIPLLSVLPRAIAIAQKMGSGELSVEVLVLFLFCGVFGLFPFLLLWGCVAWRFEFFCKRPDNGRGCVVAVKEET